MSIGLIGKKVGMTRVFNEDGEAIAVTVIDVSDNVFLQKKTSEKDGYTAVQVGYDEQKESRLNRPAQGHVKAQGGSPKKKVLEFRLDSDDQLPEVEHPGLDLFEEGQWVDVIGTSKGKGFQGVMKRYNFQGQPQSHGHMMHRRPGGVGAGTDPGRIWKNKNMPGRHGNYRKTVQNLKIVQKRPEDNVILISGAVPGSKGGYVVIRPAIKHDAPVQDLKAKEAPAEADASNESES
ncbi:MAG: 50S ribosomal protein L3 [Verrucomicrobiales bacterium]|jgi:large subunit ribosomal protein L3|nr:50S ribosomal protein L3 [Verrucomicrobiales bacterium]